MSPKDQPGKRGTKDLVYEYKAHKIFHVDHVFRVFIFAGADIQCPGQKTFIYLPQQ